MKRRIVVLISAVACIAAAADVVLREGPAEAAGMSVGRMGSLASRVGEWHDADAIVGAQWLVARNGVIVAQRAQGWADRENKVRFETDTLCQLASVTKPVTATALMILVDDGKLALDAPVSKYLPAFQRHPKVTLRHLLTHTSGLPRDVPTRIRPAMHPTWLQRRLADIADETARMKPDFEPGARYQYCNAGIATLGRVVEVVSGKEFDQFLKERLFDRLGMTSATFRPTPSMTGKIATLYADEEGAKKITYRFDPAFRITNPAPNGGLFATARDMAVFVQMFLNEGVYNGVRILSPAAVKEMLADQTPQLPQVRGLGWGLHGAWMKRPLTEAIFTHGGSSGTFLWGDKRRGVVGVFFPQTAGPRVGQAQREFFERVSLAAEPPVVTENPKWPRHVVATGYPTQTAVAADFTGDRRPDVIVNGRRQTLLYVAPDWKEVVIHQGPLDAIHSEVMDVDGDGDMDYIGARYSPGLIFWLERPADPLREPWPYHLVDDQVNGIHGVMAGDIDGDKKPDLAATSAQPKGPFPHSLAWFKVPANPRKAERWHRYVFARGDAPGLSHYVGIGDVNGDGRTDIASAAKVADGGNWFAWWEQPKDPAQAWTKQVVATKQEGATNILMADVNGDGRMDLIGSRGHGKGVVWFEAPHWKPHEINASLTGPHSLAVGDIDRDGDIDVVTCAKHDFTAAWFENDGKGNFQTHMIYGDQAAYDIRLVDMDGDGDLDVLIAGQESRNVVWYENRVAARAVKQ